MIDVDQVAARAGRLGALAAQLGKSVSACPYDPAGSPQQRVSAGAWMRSFLHWRPPHGAVNYGGEGQAGA